MWGWLWIWVIYFLYKVNIYLFIVLLFLLKYTYMKLKSKKYKVYGQKQQLWVPCVIPSHPRTFFPKASILFLLFLPPVLPSIFLNNLFMLIIDFSIYIYLWLPSYEDEALAILNQTTSKHIFPYSSFFF